MHRINLILSSALVVHPCRASETMMHWFCVKSRVANTWGMVSSVGFHQGIQSLIPAESFRAGRLKLEKLLQGLDSTQSHTICLIFFLRILNCLVVLTMAELRPGHLNLKPLAARSPITFFQSCQGFFIITMRQWDTNRIELPGASYPPTVDQVS